MKRREEKRERKMKRRKENGRGKENRRGKESRRVEDCECDKLVNNNVKITAVNSEGRN